MKPLLLLALTICTLATCAQKTERYYDFEWKETDVGHARFYSIGEATDSGWHRQDLFINGLTLQMDGVYEDSTCKTQNGKFTFAYPNKVVQSTGRYLHGKKQGLWLDFHPNGMMADSTVYDSGNPIGMKRGWHPNGYLSDSATYNADGSGVEVRWFDNGNVSFAGVLSAGFKKHGKWQFFHKNGHISAIEIYDHGQLKEKQYYDEQGQAIADTTSRDRKAAFRGGSKDWLKYLNGHLYWPPNYNITNTDAVSVVISMTVDEDGKVTDAYVSTPFYPPFENIALSVIRHSPAWTPAIEHNRRVSSQLKQPVVFKLPE